MLSKGSTGGAVDQRSPQSHLCDPGSIPVLAVSCGLSFLLVLALLRGFFYGFPLSTKTNTVELEFHLDEERLNTSPWSEHWATIPFAS